MYKIREYNKNAESYLNALVPEEYGGEDAMTCENEGNILSVKCKSKFLDLLDDKSKGFATKAYRVTKEDDAFVLWTGEYGFNSGIGPAWYIKGGE